MPKGQKRSAYERFVSGEDSVVLYNITELTEIIAGLKNDNLRLQAELKEAKKAETPSVKPIRLDSEDYARVIQLFARKRTRGEAVQDAAKPID